MGKRILDEIEIAEQGSAPANPASGYQIIFPLPDGHLYVKNSSGIQKKLTENIPVITSGTAAPSGGSDGDIYLQYT